MKTLVLVLITLLFMPLSSSSKVLLIKQWHLLASQKTLNIQESLSLPQAKNQLDLYKKLKSFINTNKGALVLFEGCEGEINESFTQVFQGWDYKKLNEKLKKSKDYSKILTHAGLKLEVEYKDKIKSLCGDDLELIREHQLAFSDLKAFLGYAQRLEFFKDKPEQFNRYAQSMVDGNLLVIDPYVFAVQSARNTFKRVKYLLHKRNEAFLSIIDENKNQPIAVVIGGLHIEDFSKQLKQRKIAYKVYTPKGYPQKDIEILDQFEKLLFKE